MAGFGPTGGWGPEPVGWVFWEILVAAALHQNNGRNERHVMRKKMYDTDDICPLYAHVRV